MNGVFQLHGTPRFGGILVVADHASARVPEGVDLGIAPALLDAHIAIDIGVDAVARIMAGRAGVAAYCADFSRLVCDPNRDEDAPCLIPRESDGHAIPGNDLCDKGREARLARFHRPYHAGLARVIEAAAPALMLSLHSFTPRLASRPDEARPWQVGVLYNRDDRAARVAIPLLAAEGLCVGDQLPYSGTSLNYTMDRHGEAEGRPYLAVEIRQDEISHPAGQALWAARLHRICNAAALALG